MLKLIVNRILFGIASGCVMLTLVGIWFDLAGNVGMPDLFNDFTAHALGFVAVGVGFSAGSIVYEIDALPLWLKAGINLSIGMGIAFLIGFNLGVLPLESPIILITIVVLQIIIYFAILFGNYLLSGREAKRINAKLREREAERDTGE